MDDATRKRVRQRGTLLRAVRDYGSSGLSFEGLEKIFRRAGMFGAVHGLEENVRYLADKGYLKLELTKEKLTRVERWLVWITPNGIDLLDGVIEPDPGVDCIA